MARGKGEGSISKRPDGTWWARITTGYDDFGNSKRKAFYGKTRKEVHDKMTAALNEMRLNKGRYVDPKKTTLADWLDEWLVTYKVKILRNTTIRMHHTHINKHIKPFFGNVTLEDLRAVMIQRFINHIAEKNYATRYRTIIINTLYQALEEAVKNDLLGKNPAKGLKIPSKVEAVKEKDILTQDEQARFVAEAKKHYQYGEAFLLMLATGIRIGETLALTWDDVDFENAEISITKGMQRSDKTGDLIKETAYKPGPPKTKSSIRTIPLLNSALELLKEKKVRDPPNERDQLFTSTVRDYPGTCQYRRVLKQVAQAAGIEKNITPHSLRHTFATRGLESGIELIVMQKLLGHSSLQMTSDIYTHVLPEKKHDSMSKLEEVIKL